MNDTLNLNRFINAQADNYETALAELRSGQKRSHWIWYIFPQLRALGRSEMACFYGIASLAEAQAYLKQPVLEQRLHKCVDTLLALPNSLTAEAVFGSLDAKKLRSSLTLFIAASAPVTFTTLLDRWYGGKADPKTLELLGV